MKHFNELQEGLQDPNIFKAFFLAGGPGSGKSYVVRKTTGGTGLRVVNSDDAFESLLQKAGLSLKMPPEEEEPRDIVRDRAKKITAKRQANYIEGRIGLIIDGTGRDYDKITKQATELKQLGYDVHMIFVNTSLDVALQRNAERPRSVPESIVTKSWNDVQSNIGKFSQYFRQNFVVVDNNNATEDVFVKVFKQIKGLLKKKVRNPAAQQWVMQQMKARGITKKPKGF
jgi:dephospho-CoA kinase|tara:strand:+ start:612 stop:1295 length:684 start_codon:yes stop_codon:yes gene_type:complete